MYSCPWRRTQRSRYRHSRLTPIRARPCLALELRRCCCSSSAFIMPGTASPTMYLSTSGIRSLSGARTKLRERKSTRTRKARGRSMRVGILGSGLMGGKLGTIFARAGHEVVFSYARSEQKLKRLARDAKGKARAGTPREAAQEADAVLLAVHWSQIEDVLNQTGDLTGKVIVTCSLPMNEDNTELVVAHSSSGVEELARMVPKARVV